MEHPAHVAELRCRKAPGLLEECGNFADVFLQPLRRRGLRESAGGRGIPKPGGGRRVLVLCEELRTPGMVRRKRGSHLPEVVTSAEQLPCLRQDGASDLFSGFAGKNRRTGAYWSR